MWMRRSYRPFLQSLEGVPCVLMGDRRDGYLSVSYDNYAGPKEGLEYLIEQLGCTNIVMAGGPNDNTDALERKNTFYEVMKAHGLEADERHFIAGNLSRKTEEVVLGIILIRIREWKRSSV